MSEIGPTSKPEVGTTSKPEVDPTSKPEVDPTSKPEVGTTLIPQIGNTASRPELATTPMPELRTTPTSVMGTTRLPGPESLQSSVAFPYEKIMQFPSTTVQPETRHTSPINSGSENILNEESHRPQDTTITNSVIETSAHEQVTQPAGITQTKETMQQITVSSASDAMRPEGRTFVTQQSVITVTSQSNAAENKTATTSGGANDLTTANSTATVITNLTRTDDSSLATETSIKPLQTLPANGNEQKNSLNSQPGGIVDAHSQYFKATEKSTKSTTKYKFRHGVNAPSSAIVENSSQFSADALPTNLHPTSAQNPNPLIADSSNATSTATNSAIIASAKEDQISSSTTTKFQPTVKFTPINPPPSPETIHQSTTVTTSTLVKDQIESKENQPQQLPSATKDSNLSNYQSSPKINSDSGTQTKEPLETDSIALLR
ncbi:mucin-5AC [Folsomia candida]|uniref:Uncharacterized protein n=1 Tax=Folsomia candida TaxID=158441 RepID=A0A226F6Q5_FOLCA|nr:mucin-5AC [Folsomia candida]OXA64891.1 hypothetical protein Fcan01_01661 [Folsomia candida]